MNESATFLASFPPIMSAIKIAGNGDGMRIQFDIPESEMGQAVKLLAWREVVLRVTIEPCITRQDQDNGKQRNDVEAGSKRKSTWTPA